MSVTPTDYFGSAEGRRVLQEAFATVLDAASSSESQDGARRLVLGGIVDADDDALVRALLELVNDNLTGELIPALVYTGKRSASTTFPPNELADIVSILEATMKNPTSAATERFGVHLCEGMTGRFLPIRTFKFKSNRLERTDRLVMLDSEATIRYALLLLMMPPYHGRLRRCELKGCPRFLLRDNTDPKALRRYCSAEHSDEGERSRTRDRVAEWRKASKRRGGSIRRHK